MPIYDSLLSLLTLSGLEIILGIDNVIFIALLVQNIDVSLRLKLRIIGLALALIFRILMLFGASWIITLHNPLFSIFTINFSGRMILLILGGGFLVIKGGMELYDIIFLKESHNKKTGGDYKSIAKIITT